MKFVATAASSDPMTVEAIRRRELVAQETADRNRRVFERAQFAPYGLDDRWTGLRAIGGRAESNGYVSSLTLAHGDDVWDPSMPQVRVETSLIGSEDIARSLVHEFWHETGVLSDEVRRAVFAFDGGSVDPFEPWNAIEVPVDDVAVEFHMLVHDDYWVAGGFTAHVAISLRSRRWPVEQTGIVTITDVRPYLDGSVELARRWRPRNNT